MKTHLLSLLFTLLLNTVYAQTEKGSFLIGNNIGLLSPLSIEGSDFSNFSIGSSSTLTSSEPLRTQFNLNLSPSVSYFLHDNISLGLNCNIYVNGFTYATETIELIGRESFFSLGQQMHYFLDYGNFKPYLTLNAFYTYGRWRTSSLPGLVNSENYILLGSGSGLAYFVNKNCAFNLELYLNYLAPLGSSRPNFMNEFFFGLDIGIMFFIN